MSNNFEELRPNSGLVDFETNLRKMLMSDISDTGGLVELLKSVEAPTKSMQDLAALKTGCPLPDQILTLEFMRKNLLTWSNKTFGQRRDPLTKLEDELRELKENPKDISEYADVLTLLLDAFSMHFPETSAQKLLQAAYDKMEINKKRKWAPVPDKPGTWQHIK